jgi:hypothetical protein
MAQPERRYIRDRGFNPPWTGRSAASVAGAFISVGGWFGNGKPRAWRRLLLPLLLP